MPKIGGIAIIFVSAAALMGFVSNDINNIPLWLRGIVAIFCLAAVSFISWKSGFDYSAELCDKELADLHARVKAVEDRKKHIMERTRALRPALELQERLKPKRKMDIH